MNAKTVVAAMIVATAIAASGTAMAQEGARETISLTVDCRDSAELTREICFPYAVKSIDVELKPTATGGARIDDQRITDGGCISVKLSAFGERRYTPESPGSFESRAEKARDPVRVVQCKPTHAAAIVRVKY
jgi:hypothetical protein